MAFSLFGLVYISSWERRTLSPDHILLTKLHEQGHQRRWWALAFNRKQRHQEECLAQSYAYKEMIKLGYTPEQLDNLEVDYRFIAKYGLTYKQYKEMVRGSG